MDVKEEDNSQVEKRSNLGKVLPHLQCVKCQDFFRGPVFDCANYHTTCSLCCGFDIKSSIDKVDIVFCPVEDCKIKTNCGAAGMKLTKMVVDLKLKVPCKNRDIGCTYQGIEYELEEHEDECGYRNVKCDFAGCKYILFKDLLNHMKHFHKMDYEVKRWKLTNKIKLLEDDESIGYKFAHRDEIGPDGLMFNTQVWQYDGCLSIAVRVMGGKEVAKKYRVEIRVSSNESLVSFTHSGPVFPIDYYPYDSAANKDGFEMTCSRFALFNHGKEHFGIHNKDKNGDTVLPISVKIEKKELGLPTD